MTTLLSHTRTTENHQFTVLDFTDEDADLIRAYVDSDEAVVLLDGGKPESHEKTIKTREVLYFQ